ncbi:hypothetical protein [Burkholderia perseverans]|uniref:hypothetical protein n=1 Tax=Burkholderia perseverans TaxID=2615214 RepID=UPI001FEEE79D|nr:hypothetical protein [Burkholderia perseverans]
MQVTLDPAALVMGFVTILLVLLQGLILQWVRSVQSKQKDSEDRDAAFRDELASLRVSMARDFVSRTEQRDLRDEFRDVLKSVNQNLIDINNKLDRKMDKQ